MPIQTPTTSTYNDQAVRPTTPELQAVEDAYRAAYLAGARSTLKWHDRDLGAVGDARIARMQAQEQAEVKCGRRVVGYREGHELEAARTRGMYQALHQAWDTGRMLEHRYALQDEEFNSMVLAQWVEAVKRWAGEPIDPQRIVRPPEPEGCISPEMLEKLEAIARSRGRSIGVPLAKFLKPQAAHTLALPHPTPGPAIALPTSKPVIAEQAIIRKLADVERELLHWLWPGRIPWASSRFWLAIPAWGRASSPWTWPPALPAATTSPTSRS